MLAGVLLVNMVLLAPRLHTRGPSSGTSSSSGHSDMAGWHNTGGASAPGAAAATASNAPGQRTAGGRTSSGSSITSSSRQSDQQQQRGLKQPHGDLWHDFDENGDGVLGPTEFQAMLQVGERCGTGGGTAGVGDGGSRCVRGWVAVLPFAV